MTSKMRIWEGQSQVKGILNLEKVGQDLADILVHQIWFVVLQFLKGFHCWQISEVHHQRVGSISFECLSQIQHDEQTFQSYLNCFGVLSCQAVHIVPDDIGGFVYFEDVFGGSWVSKIWENIADLSLNVVSVRFKELEYFLDDGLSVETGLDLSLVASSDVRDDPASLPPDNFFVMVENFLKGAEQIVLQKLVSMLGCSCRYIAKDSDGGDQDGHIGRF